MATLKEIVHGFIADEKGLGESHRYDKSISEQGRFDKIPEGEAGINLLASFLDEAISEHAKIKHTDITKYEDPNIKVMPNLGKRQGQYFIFLTNFFNNFAQMVDNELLVKFKDALINSVRNTPKHLLKRVAVTHMYFWRKDDNFSDESSMLQNLVETLAPANQHLFN